MTRRPSVHLDLDDASRRALEFDDVLGWVASLARTPIGRERIRSLVPSAEIETVRARLEALDETRRHLVESGRHVAVGLPDPRAGLAALAIAGGTLDGKGIRDLARLIESSARVRASLGALDRESFPHLERLGRSIPDLRSEADAVLRGTDSEGGVVDEASDELRRLRGAAARVGDRLRRTLRRYLRDPRSESVIRDDFVTQRNERYVIPVRTDAPREIRGIVHASSSSGATRFIEPLETVESNNELVRLFDEVREEQQRILAAWSSAFRARLEEVHAALDGLARADSLEARCAFAEACNAVTPRVVPDGPLRLHGLRHPLLQRRLEAEGGLCVPSDIELDPADRVLVLSGPNTGGKTVALKALGLAATLAQCGIPVPAGSAELPLYRQLRADIGDHQSIEADLSTYSAHIRAISESIRAPSPPALFIFDEIGTGTEPTEGAAVARAILESLTRPGITTVATTHLGPLKAWAVLADGVSCAAMDFDAETFTPTYRIVMGVAGRSGGLDIAERLGLDRSIVSRARGLLDPQVREGEDYLRRLREALTEAEREAERSIAERQALESERRDARIREEREAEIRRRETAAALKRVLEEFRGQVRKELSALAAPVERARVERRAGRAERRLDLAGARHTAELGGPETETTRRPQADPSRLSAGDRVWVEGLGRAGELVALKGHTADVRLGEVVFQVPQSELRLPAAADSVASRSAKGERARVEPHPVRSCPRELKLIGKRVDEALAELDRFLDAAHLAEHEEVRVVHGHGTGRLRAAVREFLSDHIHVQSRRPGRAPEGGDGATVVKLRF